MANILILDNHENFISYLDQQLLDVTETFKDGLRSIDVTYNLSDIEKADTFFRSGNKIFISGDGNLAPCLYVLNTKIKKDLYVENKYSFSAEEVLVELNYAPLVGQHEITASNGFTTSANGEVKVNYNALYYWFNDYFNIGVVQDCISNYASKIEFSGTMNRMSLLRYIEEETGNTFVTRYEKDILNNTIHRYIDFLNPTNENKNWELHFDYDFVEQTTTTIYDSNGNVTTEDPTSETVEFEPNIPMPNINPENIQFRITDGRVLLNTEGTEYDEDDPTQTPLLWEATDLGLDGNTSNVVISIKYQNDNLAVKIHEKIFNVCTEDVDILCGISENGYINNIYEDSDYINSVSMLNGSCFEFYDSANEKVIFQHVIDAILSTVHEDILDIGKNIQNVEYEEDESDTFFAVSPVLSIKKDSSSSNSLSHSDMERVIHDWKTLVVSKNSVIPMIVQKMTITGTDENPCTQRTGHPSTGRSAEEILGTYNVSNNYYKRPLKPNDNTDSENKSYEYWVATAYWSAPFSKVKHDLYLSVDTSNDMNYPAIKGRPDSRDPRAVINTPKMGNVETSEEDRYAIYNEVAMKLIEKKDPKFNITVDVANLANNKYNDYNVNDKVYIKLPGFNNLVTAKVISTVKNLRNISENKITLGNYSANTKNILTSTYIDAKNINFKYPGSKNLSATLKDSTDDNKKLKNKVLTFTLYSVDRGSRTLTKKIHSKKTNSQGRATIPCKYDPGQYEMEIRFGGDAEYSECVMTVEISVGGVKEVSTDDATYETVTTYYDKYGRSPDKKTLMAIGLPTRGSSLKQYGYRFMKATFKNECPACHKDTLYWGWNYGKYFRGRNEWMGSKEGHFFCDNCDADFDGISGENHNKSGKPKMVRLTDPVKSSREEAQKLVNGQMEYGTKKVKVDQKNNTSDASRTVAGSPNEYVKKKALSIVGNSTGLEAAQKIAAFMGSKIKYASYANFVRSAQTVLQKKSGNCCDQTRCMLELMDAAGCTTELTLQYIHVCCSKKGLGHMFSKITTKSDGKWRYVDPCKKNPWGNYVKGWGSPSNPRKITNYPTKPF